MFPKISEKSQIYKTHERYNGIYQKMSQQKGCNEVSNSFLQYLQNAVFYTGDWQLNTVQ